MQDYDDLAIRVALRQLARRSPMPVCICDEGEIVYVEQTAYEVLFAAANGAIVLRHQDTRAVVQMDPGVGVSPYRPLRLGGVVPVAGG